LTPAIAQSTDPKLTTVEQHGQEVGESAFEILIGRLEGTSKEQKNNNRIVKTNLVVRGTTK
jgi:LacI family transcriptional regulator